MRSTPPMRRRHSARCSRLPPKLSRPDELAYWSGWIPATCHPKSSAFDRMRCPRHWAPAYLGFESSNMSFDGSLSCRGTEVAVPLLLLDARFLNCLLLEHAEGAGEGADFVTAFGVACVD